uniref:Uncharacterized protein n=1 Tax=Setaria italica TaxID=4555 RepID=K3YKQ5_SETIT
MATKRPRMGWRPHGKITCLQAALSLRLVHEIDDPSSDLHSFSSSKDRTTIMQELPYGF